MKLGTRKAALFGCALVVLLGAGPAFALDGAVEKGIREVENGDYDAAIVTLDIAVKKLTGQTEKGEDLGRAYLYLGIAYVGKGHEAAAKSRFRQAVRQLRNLSLSSEEFPPKIIGIFEAAREEELRDRGAAPAAAVPTPAPGQGKADSPAARAAGPATRAPEGKDQPSQIGSGAPKKKGGGKKWLFIGGGAVGALAVAGAAGKKDSGSSGPPPSVTASREPVGTAIVDVTELLFTASASNLTAPAYTWSFSDGGVAAGQRVPHTFTRTGDSAAVVTASGSEGRAEASVGVPVANIDGRWGNRSEQFGLTFELQQHGREIGGSFVFEANVDGVWVQTERGNVSGELANPRNFRLREDGRCGTELEGQFNASLENMVGRLCRPGCPAPENGQTCWEATSFARVP